MYKRLSIGILASINCVIMAAPWTVVECGAIGDGKTDATAAFQKALDTAAQAGGGVVDVPSGEYRINGFLLIPGGVTLQGTYRTPPTNDHEARPRMDGSVLQAYSGRGKPEAAPFIRLNGSNAVLMGVVITYPEWKQADVPPVAYPPTVFADYTTNTAVVDCLFLNSYAAIHFQNAARYLVRSVYGYPSYRGFYTDNCGDIGRVENCHFWPFGVAYKPDDPFCQWVNTHGVAFEFARTDWQYVLNTFCFGYGVGYKFSETKNGSCNGNFVGIGADSCRRPILVEQAQAPGLLITNAELVGRWGSTDSVGIEVAPSVKGGKVSVSNSAFWGPLDRCLWQRSAAAQVTVIGSNFCNWDNGSTGSAAIEIAAGKAIVQGNTFADGETHVRVAAGVESAIIIGNQATAGLVVDNQAGARTQVLANELSPVVWTKDAKLHYRVDVGAPGDRAWVRKWHAQEAGGEWTDRPGTKRWSGAESLLLLPVVKGRTYTLTLELFMPVYALSPDAGLYLGERRLAAFPDQAGTAVITATLPALKTEQIVLTVRCQGWCPKDLMPGNLDTRVLGVGVRSVTLRAKRAPKSVFDACRGTWQE